MNIDPQKFIVSNSYVSGVLPDGTFKVNLQSSNTWAYSMQFKPLVDEFQAKLGQDFPFFKNKDGRPQYLQLPMYYDGGNQMHMPPQQNQFNNSKLDGALKRKSEENVKQLHDALQSEVNDLSNDFRTLLKKQGEMKLTSQHIDAYNEQLTKMDSLIAVEMVELNNYYDTNNQKTQTEDTCNSIFYPTAPDQEQVLNDLAGQRATKEVYSLWMDLIEDDKVSLKYEDIQKVIEKLAKEEFNMKFRIKNSKIA